MGPDRVAPGPRAGQVRGQGRVMTEMETETWAPGVPLERTLLARGLEFGGLEWPGRGGTPVVLVHGWLDQAAIWAGMAPALGRRVFGMDLRGHGRSAHSASGDSLHFLEYLADLDAVLDVLEEHWGPGPVDLVGHSLGGSVVSIYAGIRPERIRRLVLLDGLGLSDNLDGSVERLVQYLDGVKAPLVSRVLPSFEAAVERLRERLEGLDEPAIQLYVRRHVRSGPEGLSWSFDERLRRRFGAPYRQDAHLLVLARITAPTLLLVPEHTLFHPAEIDRLAAAIPDHRREDLPGLGHALHVQAAGEVARRICRFLDG